MSNAINYAKRERADNNLFQSMSIGGKSKSVTGKSVREDIEGNGQKCNNIDFLV